MRALGLLVPLDRGKRIDRHIDYFGSGVAAASISRDRLTRRR